MVHLIDKDALVAELERRKKQNVLTNEGVFEEDIDILYFLNTIELKEVDLETAFAASIDHFDEKNKCGRWPESDLRDFAKHFFELGIKTKEE